MSDLAVTSLTIEELLKNLRGRTWQIPQFQREFVWTVGDVIELVHSIFCARPIGMATIWEQPDDTSLELGPISLPDKVVPGMSETRVTFCQSEENPRKLFAVLDGLQRCTAIAMAFGGFRTDHGDYRTSGRYYLNVSALDPLEQIVFIKEEEVQSKHFNNDATCISQGYFPLASNNPCETFMGQWLRYIQAIQSKNYYTNGELPPPDELERRNNVLKKAFEGINKTKLAVYIVPDTYSLADICDIFEKLNTTGTKVSTVDLIHSWLYADTAKDATGPIRLREWLDDFGQKDGVIGWSDSNDRPELPVQIVTACHVALEEKAQPRKVGRGATTPIASVKAGDLLATPTAHWKLIMGADNMLAEYLKDFQRLVASGMFPWKWCPYPVTSAIYVALRVHMNFDSASKHPWGIDDLNALFKAFFWRNALTNRYDQGFLTQLGVDIKELKRLLSLRPNFSTASAWAAAIEGDLRALISKPLPSREDLYQYLSDGRPSGAMQKALFLPMLAASDKDLLDDTISMRFPEAGTSVQLHHIYPRDWCRNNKIGALSDLLDKNKAGKDWVNSVCNLMPLSRQSNNLWKAKNPGQVLVERQINYIHSSNRLKNLFIDQECFDFLLSGADGMEAFWVHRAELLIADFIPRMNISI
ncbi:DUF262 domain-containing protein [Geomonas nitrogeniifigens]|uniref:DUF262 domain-containing protein n=1 Tax=Geomonas diazotrophica TaxID=2843197 RepID=UPI001C2B852C|nr:DUF262 domain-containing protein [Geomonas nitrogeniifigens]QXE87414.1 DUF262 domain-containing protein [Geomonas nitrogeniifigens]